MTTILSDLVTFRDDLNGKLANVALSESIGNICTALTTSVDASLALNQPSLHEGLIQTIAGYQTLLTQSDTNKVYFQSMINNINLYIDSISSQPKFENDILYDANFQKGQRKRIFSLNDDVDQLIKNSLLKYSDWHYPALRIGCGHVGQTNSEVVVDNMVVIDTSKSREYNNLLAANDPLYVCDFNEKVMEDSINHFNSIYYRRINQYTIKDHDFSQFPQQQFGFIFCWMFFNYTKLTTIELYLKSLFNLLREGGTLMFSYNNIDLPDSARVSELGLMSAISKRQLLSLVEKIGFKVVHCYDIPNDDIVIKNISWVEVSRPGYLQSIKLRQALGELR